MLTVCTWLWGTKYSFDYVAKLAAGVKRHMTQAHRFVLISDEPYSPAGVDEVWPILDKELLGRGCLARLRMFDRLWQDRFGIEERLVCLDLDVIITGQLDPLFNRAENFVILQGANSVNPCPFNGSVMMLRSGTHQDVWSDFSTEKVSKVPWYAFPDDQSWLFYKIPQAAGWETGPRSGIWSFQKNNWPQDNKLPRDARIVAFPGHRDPSQFTHLDWVREHWQA